MRVFLIAAALFMNALTAFAQQSVGVSIQSWQAKNCGDAEFKETKICVDYRKTLDKAKKDKGEEKDE